MKNNKGVSIIEIIISIALISLIMVFLFRLLVLVRSEDNLNKYTANINVLSAQVISDIHDDINSKGLKYIFKPTCVSNTDTCCCASDSHDCLKFNFFTNEVKELSFLTNENFLDSIRYGKVKRVLPPGYSFLSNSSYNMGTTNKIDISLVGEGQYVNPLAYGMDSLMITKIPIYNGKNKSKTIEIREVYNYTENGSILSSTCQKTNNSMITKRASNSSKELFWNYSGEITEINFQKSSTIPSTAVENWDISANQDNRVKAYIVDDGSGNNTYKLYIQSTDQLYANSNSSYLFNGFTKLTTINNLGLLNTEFVTNMSNMFSNNNLLLNLNLSSINTSNVTNMSNMFAENIALINLNLSSFDTTKVTNMSNMFYGCNNLISITMTSFDTKNVKDMSFMFAYCNKLLNVDLTNFVTTSLNNMKGTFYGCSSLISLNLNSLDTSGVTNMSMLFSGCINLNNISLSKMITISVIDMSKMFYDCSSITSLNLETFQTTNVTNMDSMFGNCTNLSLINLANFDTRKVTNMAWMFASCTALKNIYFQTAIFTSVSSYSNMFSAITSGINISVRNSTAKTFIEARLTNAEKTGNVVIYVP